MRPIALSINYVSKDQLATVGRDFVICITQPSLIILHARRAVLRASCSPGDSPQQQQLEVMNNNGLMTPAVVLSILKYIFIQTS